VLYEPPLQVMNLVSSMLTCINLQEIDVVFLVLHASISKIWT
jgi:hypothetical protein